MIDPETDIFHAFSIALGQTFPDVTVSGEYTDAPSSPLHVTLEMKDNHTVVDTKSAEDGENHVSLLFEVNVYVDKTRAKKQTAKQIMNRADAILTEMGFSRIMMNPIPNYAGAKAYRITARYRAVSDKQHNLWR